jgi:transposase
MSIMSGETLEEFYSQILGFEWPWEVQEIIREGITREVRVIVTYAEGEAAHCPICGKAVRIHDRKKRRWRHLDSCNHKTIIEADIPRIRCPADGVLQIPVPWAEKNSRFTAELERHVCRWLNTTPISEVAGMFGLSWDQVANIQERAVRRGIAKRQKASVKKIGVDETSFQKRHEYVTVVLDKDRSTVLDILQDRKADTLDAWFKTQEVADLQDVESISMDMWDPFIKAVQDNFKGWEQLIAFDRYHVAQHLNKAVDKVRAQEHRKLLSERNMSELAGTKFEWLRTSSKWDNRTGGRPAFMQLTKMNLKTARAWRIKEVAASLWNYEYLGVAKKRWKELLGWISRCRLGPMIKAGNTIKRYFWGILNAIQMKTSNAMLESLNSGIQRIKRMACGFRNRTRFRMAILFHFGGLALGF